MVHYALKKGAEEIVVDLQQTDDRDGMISYLIENQNKLFFYTTLVDDEYRVFHDIREVDQHHPLDPVELANIINVFKTGIAFEIGKAPQPWTYASIRFHLKDKSYVLMVL